MSNMTNSTNNNYSKVKKRNIIIIATLAVALIIGASVFGACVLSAPCDDCCSHEHSHSSTLTASQIFSRYSQSVAMVQAGSQIGTGFLVYRQTGIGTPIYILTNHHIVQEFIADNSTPITITFNRITGDEHSSFTNAIRVVGYDSYFDIALLEVRFSFNFAQRTLIRFNNNQTPTGEMLTALGNMDGQGISVFGGLLSNNNLVADFGVNAESNRFKPLYQVNASFNPGVSGAPIFCTRGYVVGMAAFRRLADSGDRPVQNISYVVSSQIFMPLVNNAIANNKNDNLDNFGNLFSSPVARMNTQNSLTLVGLGGLTITRQGTNFTVTHAGVPPSGFVDRWFMAGDTISSVGGVYVNEQTTWVNLMAIVNQFSVLNQGDTRLRVTVNFDSITINIDNFRKGD